MWSPIGRGKRTISPDQGDIFGSDGRGIRAQVTPDGDCREAVFTARGASLQVPPLSAVQIEYEEATGLWTPIFFGEVRQGGNPRNVTGEDYVLRGLAQRLREAALPPGFSTPKQPAHLTVRAIIISAIGSGALGRGFSGADDVSDVGGGAPLVEYDEALCPDLGFDGRELRSTDGLTAYELLEKIAQDGAGLGVTVAWGVRPDRKFFFKARRADVLPLVAESLIAEEWKAPIAETPVTVVRWYIAKRADGTPITYDSRSPLAETYADRLRSIPLDSTAIPWAPVPGEYGMAGGQHLNGFTRSLSDGRLYRNGTVTSSISWLKFDSSADMVLTLTPSQPFSRIVLDGNSSGIALTLFAGGQSFPIGVLTAGERIFYVEGSGDVTLTAATPEGSGASGLSGILTLFEFRADRIDHQTLDRMAEYHYSFPASEPADLEFEGFRAPADLSGRVQLGTYERAVEVWEYRLTDDRGLTMGVLTGQADDPYKLAQALLLKRQASNAVITAVSALG